VPPPGQRFFLLFDPAHSLMLPPSLCFLQWLITYHQTPPDTSFFLDFLSLKSVRMHSDLSLAASHRFCIPSHQSVENRTSHVPPPECQLYSQSFQVGVLLPQLYPC